MECDTYVITLESSPKVISYLEQFDIEPIIIEGINGKTCETQIIKDNIDSMYSIYGPKSAQGCAMSHMKAWKQFASSQKEMCVIFEDDVVLEENFIQDFKNAIKQVPQDFDILYLGCFGSENEPNFFTVVMGALGMSKTSMQVSENIKVPSVALGAHAYVLSKKGASKLIDNLYGKIYNHIDYCMQDLSRQNILTTYAVSPRIAYQTSTDTSFSTNVSSTHPLLINKLLSYFYVDKMVRANYISSLSFARILSLNINIITIMFLLLGCIFAFFKVRLRTLTLMFVILSIADIVMIFRGGNISILVFHYMVFILPTLIINSIKMLKQSSTQN